VKEQSCNAAPQSHGEATALPLRPLQPSDMDAPMADTEVCGGAGPAWRKGFQNACNFRLGRDTARCSCPTSRLWFDWATA
jgi:hypothetical protein